MFRMLFSIPIKRLILQYDSESPCQNRDRDRNTELKVPGTGTAGSETSLASRSLSRNRSGVYQLIWETKKTRRVCLPLSGAKPDLKCPFRSVAQISSFSRSVLAKDLGFFSFFPLSSCFDRQTVSWLTLLPSVVSLFRSHTLAVSLESLALHGPRSWSTSPALFGPPFSSSQMGRQH